MRTHHVFYCSDLRVGNNIGFAHVWDRNPEAMVVEHSALYTKVASLENAYSTEGTWCEMNVVDGTELPVQLKVRSMCVGDVIVESIDGPMVTMYRAFVCMAAGFAELKKVPPNFYEQL